ncbi:thioredoxin reductase [bacterium]|nr:thioredoxin reductase [bacterium]|tara:strand:- start:6813 stop:7784 length:972 start_codon:yes stop_codon:yes gene_type:complete
MEEHYDVVIIGTGAAGLAASLYAGRYKMKVLTIGEDFGGATATAWTIWNYPGAKAIDGYDLMKIMKEQAENVGAKIIDGKVTKVEKEGDCFVVSTRDKKYETSTVIFAIGTERRHLGLPNEKELTGKGIHYCATCDAPLYIGKTIIVVGGGDASVKGINLAGEYADKIYLITMEKELHGEPINLEQMEKLGDKVEVLYETTIEEIIGTEKFEKVKLSKEFNGNNELVADGLFIEIGAVPDVELPKSLGVALDEEGYIKVNNMMQTNIPGICAAGDAVNIFGSFKQDITAACTGSVAATSAYEFERKYGGTCEKHTKPHVKNTV